MSCQGHYEVDIYLFMYRLGILYELRNIKAQVGRIKACTTEFNAGMPSSTLYFVRFYFFWTPRTPILNHDRFPNEGWPFGSTRSRKTGNGHLSFFWRFLRVTKAFVGIFFEHLSLEFFQWPCTSSNGTSLTSLVSIRSLIGEHFSQELSCFLTSCPLTF